MEMKSTYVDALESKDNAIVKRTPLFAKKYWRIAVIIIIVILVLGSALYPLMHKVLRNAEHDSVQADVDLKTLVNDRPIEKDYPVIVNEYAEIGGWRINNIQPYLIGFESFDRGTYLVLDLNKDASGDEFLAYMTGDVNGTSYREVVSVTFTSGNGNSSRLYYTYEDMEKAFTPGKQLGLYYLANYPEADQRTPQNCENLGNFCKTADLSDYLENTGSLVTLSTLHSNPNEVMNKILPVLGIYADLKDR